MATSISNGNGVQSTRNNRLGNFGQATSMNSHNSAIGKAFGNGNSGWSDSIWSNGGLGSTFTDGPADTGLSRESSNHSSGGEQFLEKTGSGSLLSTSESDGWNGRQVTPWNTMHTTSNPPSNPQTKNPSPTRHRNSDHSAPPPMLNGNGRSVSPYFTAPRSTAVGHSIGPSPQKSLLNPSTSAFSTSRSFEPGAFPSYLGIENDEDSRRQYNNAGFGNNQMVNGLQGNNNFSHDAAKYTFDRSTLTTNSGLSASRSGLDSGSIAQSRPPPYAQTHFSRSSASFSTPRPPHSTQPSFHSETNESIDRSAQNDNFLAGNFGRMSLQGADSSFDYQGHRQRPSFNSYTSYDPTASRQRYQFGTEEASSNGHGAYTPDGVPEAVYNHQTSLYRNIAIGERESASLTTSDYKRALNSPYYSTGGTPPASIDQYRPVSGNRYQNRATNNQATLLEQKLRDVEHDQRYFSIQAQSNPMQARISFDQPYEVTGYNTMRINPAMNAGMNTLNPNIYYTLPPQYNGNIAMPSGPRAAVRDHDPSQIVRSPLLEEFRTNNKTSKRYELKDIYNHVVEFSGDQHGSRFIQQKLETANSDEKDQIFSEIQNDAIQLMTDVFGNYVIQKLFEHGNQSQKRILANQMKGHVLTLSTQMYGCRVVQKALEHILTDQQALMVKELEAHVLKCVKDQNGNHVIQKAIERVPAEHILFITNAFHGQVHRLAQHPYGCRVIQRMLEHCEESVRQSILAELHEGAPSLIQDQFGNYVIQHVIAHGEEQNRSKIVTIVISHLLAFSKHKFASNVVEKSIENAAEKQKAEILRTLTVANDRGESPVPGLMRDQYGNYVIQKVLGILKGAEREALIEQIKPQLAQLKKIHYGKQIIAIEKLIFGPGPSPVVKPRTSMGESCPDSGAPTPLDQSSQSSSLPSTNTSVVEGPAASTKSVTDDASTGDASP